MRAALALETTLDAYAGLTSDNPDIAGRSLQMLHILSDYPFGPASDELTARPHGLLRTTRKSQAAESHMLCRRCDHGCDPLDRFDARERFGEVDIEPMGAWKRVVVGSPGLE